MPASRLRQTARHTLASVLVLAVVASGVITLWHPWGLWKVSGVLPLLGLLALTVLASGPLLTAITFKPASTTRQRLSEICVLALLQLGFLVLGVAGIYQSRPLFLVAEGRQLVLVNANELSESAKSIADARFPTRWHDGPQRVSVATINDGLFGSISNRAWQPAFYQSWPTAVPLLLGRNSGTSQTTTVNLHVDAATTSMTLDANGNPLHVQ